MIGARELNPDILQAVWVNIRPGGRAAGEALVDAGADLLAGESMPPRWPSSDGIDGSGLAMAVRFTFDWGPYYVSQGRRWPTARGNRP